MDRISLLSDDVILNILSMVPSKDAVTTSLLSKRWVDLWKRVPKLEYRDPERDAEQWRASSFVHNFLLLHKAPVLETLHLRLGNCRPTDIETCIRIAIARGVRDLLFYQYSSSLGAIRLPRSLYTCETLVTLRLKYAIVVDVPLTMCFRSLRVLVLVFVNFSSDETVHRLLSGCPVLEDLTVIRRGNDNVKTLTIMVPSLQRLQVLDLKFGDHQVPGDDFEVVIKAPSLRSLRISNQFRSMVKMPNLVKANIKLPNGDSKKLLGSLTSAKILFLCVNQPLESYPIGVFYQLVSLTLCTCSSDWFRLILKHTPKLRVLRFQLLEKLLPGAANYHRYCNSSGDVENQWERPSSVPQCLISSLEAVEWIGYKGTEAEKKVIVYLLENTGQLKKMFIRPIKSTSVEERHKMLQELSSTRGSSSKSRVLLLVKKF